MSKENPFGSPRNRRTPPLQRVLDVIRANPKKSLSREQIYDEVAAQKEAKRKVKRKLVGEQAEKKGLESELRVKAILERLPGVKQVIKTDRHSFPDSVGYDLGVTFHEGTGYLSRLRFVFVQVKSSWRMVDEFKAKNPPQRLKEKRIVILCTQQSDEKIISSFWKSVDELIGFYVW
jgi:hypothetical protein